MQHSSTMPLAVILAGGRASRLGGGDKLLRLVGGKPILGHIAARLAAQAAPIVINANGDPARLAAWGLPVIADLSATARGPLAGVHAGLALARERGCEWLLTVPSDVPFLPFDLVARLAAARGGGLSAIAASGGRSHPVIGLWHHSLLEEAEAAIAREHFEMHRWAEQAGAATASWQNLPADPFLNINTPEDLAAAEALAAHAA